MQDKALQVENKYLSQFGSKKSLTKVANVDERIDISGGGSENTAILGLNGIGIASFQLAHTIQSIRYQQNKNLGSFIIIDIQTNNTARFDFIE